MKDAFGASTELIKGGGGEFIVTVDGRKIFSKKEIGRFPDDGEIAGLIKKIA